MKSNKKKYPFNQCALYKCRSRKRLANILFLNYHKLNFIANIVEYTCFETNKKNSKKKRKISAPCKELKYIQKRILSLFQNIERPDWLISGEKGKSYINNALYHKNSKYSLTLDIKSFYDNCSREYVFLFFKKKLLMPNDIAKILTDIITYNGKIPAGTPTSQLIAYYAYEDMFYEIKQLADTYNCLFTLYVDDMSFSSTCPFNHIMLSKQVNLILHKYGHKLKASKINYYSKNNPKRYTGAIISPNGVLEIPNTLQKNIFFDFQQIKDMKQISIKDKHNISTYNSLVGRLNAASLIDKTKFKEIKHLTQLINVKN